MTSSTNTITALCRTVYGGGSATTFRVLRVLIGGEDASAGQVELEEDVSLLRRRMERYVPAVELDSWSLPWVDVGRGKEWGGLARIVMTSGFVGVMISLGSYQVKPTDSIFRK